LIIYNLSGKIRSVKESRCELSGGSSRRHGGKTAVFHRKETPENGADFWPENLSGKYSIDKNTIAYPEPFVQIVRMVKLTVKTWAAGGKIDRFLQNIRKCAGFRASAVEQFGQVCYTDIVVHGAKTPKS
jgi:hypothetical protein